MPTPTPAPPFPGAAEGRQVEEHLAALCTVIGAGQWKLGKVRTAVLATVAEIHSDHTLALAAQDPTERPTAAPSPSATPPTEDPEEAAAKELSGLDLSEALAVVADTADAAQRQHRQAAAATTGGAALLWGSLAVAARQTKSALSLGSKPPRTAPVAERPPLDEQTDIAALGSAISQAHAIVYGYQVAVAEFGFDSDQRNRADAALVAHRRTRDTLTDWLSERNVVPPAAEATYDLPEKVTSAATAARLIRTMELAYQPFLGAVLAAVTKAGEKSTALAALQASSAASLRWGGPLVRWPGWPD